MVPLLSPYLQIRKLAEKGDLPGNAKLVVESGFGEENLVVKPIFLFTASQYFPHSWD